MTDIHVPERPSADAFHASATFSKSAYSESFSHRIEQAVKRQASSLIVKRDATSPDEAIRKVFDDPYWKNLYYIAGLPIAREKDPYAALAAFKKIHADDPETMEVVWAAFREATRQ